MDTPIRLAGVIRESVVDGPGWRFVVFVQGCTHNCPGCQNPQTHDLNGGYMSTVENLYAEIKKDPLLRGVTFSGGDPFVCAKEMAVLGDMVHGLGLDIVTYTGYTYEEILKGATEKNGWMRLLEVTDYLIDGRFEIEKLSLELKFRGSSNQRIIDVKKSLESGHAVEIEF